MGNTSPLDIDIARVESLLAQAQAHRAVPARMEVLSGLLLGCPYQSNPLVGSPENPEVFVSSLAAFDCVTYVETVLALAGASTAQEFAERLRRIRYEGGQVEWARRNHYMLDWMKNNRLAGNVWPVAAERLAVRKDRLLDAVPGLPPRQVHFWCVPKPQWKKLEPRVRTSDVIFFVSTRNDLDIFHCGLLVKGDAGFRMRHAARSRQSVVEQDLAEFLRENSMSGLMAVRPVGEIRGGNP